LTLVPDDRKQFTTGSPDSPDSPDGAVVAAVKTELATLSATERRPGLAASAIRMAEIVDSKPLATTAPSAQRRLQAALTELRGASVEVGGKLAEVAAMTQRPRRKK
jgi:cobalamin biosynthesis protein CbiG